MPWQYLALPSSRYPGWGRTWLGRASESQELYSAKQSKLIEGECLKMTGCAHFRLKKCHPELVIIRACSAGLFRWTFRICADLPHRCDLISLHQVGRLVILTAYSHYSVMYLSCLRSQSAFVTMFLLITHDCSWWLCNGGLADQWQNFPQSSRDE